MLIKTDAENAFDKTQHSLMVKKIKTLIKQDMKGKFLKLIKGIYEELIVNSILNSQILNIFLLLLKTSKIHPFSLFLFKYCIGGLS